MKAVSSFLVGMALYTCLPVLCLASREIATQWNSAEKVSYWLFWNSKVVTTLTPTSFNFQLSSSNNDDVMIYAADSNYCQPSFMDAGQFPNNVRLIDSVDSLSVSLYYGVSGPARSGMCIGVKCVNTFEDCSLKGTVVWLLSTNNTQSCKYGMISATPNNVVNQSAFGSCATPGDQAGVSYNPVYLPYADQPGEQAFNAVYCEGSAACLDPAFVNEVGELDMPKVLAAAASASNETNFEAPEKAGGTASEAKQLRG